MNQQTEKAVVNRLLVLLQSAKSEIDNLRKRVEKLENEREVQTRQDRP